MAASGTARRLAHVNTALSFRRVAAGCALIATAASAPSQTAPREEHWAFVAPTAEALPAVESSWPRDPIDHFVLARLQHEGLQPSAAADRRTLARRLHLDLTGLPPSPADLRTFLADDSPAAYERLVDRLLASKHYGEHMARYWLDLVRFADTNGRHHDHYREMSPYRDWVIRSFNDNRPYDEFVVDQIAGDLHANATLDQRTASGFHRLHLIIDVGTALPEESRAQNVIDRVTAYGTAFLGLTVHCAVCHDHKYDPITQRDFFGLYAFFNNIDAQPETGRRGGPDFHRGLQPPYESLPTAAQREQLAAIEQELARKKDGDKNALRAVQRRRDELLKSIPAAMVMREREEMRATHVFVRGAYDQLGEAVARATPAFLPPLEHEGTPTRMDLANWTVARDNPLTARAAVNRFWQQFFGTGLVKTSEDLGVQGERPSHPALLDHLAIAFVDSNWDVKALVRRIVMSATYRQTSKAPAAAFARDPDNRLLARGARFRLDAEVIRDSALATSGLLDRTLFGRSVKPPQPPGIWQAVTLPDSLPRVYVADTGAAAHRRSIYTFWKRGLPPPQLTILNAPTREYCTARRERTNTPLQALLLLNDPQQIEAARELAKAILAGSPITDRARIASLWEAITGARPETADVTTLERALRDLRATYEGDEALARELSGPTELTPSEVAAWTMIASTIYNLDVTKTRQ